MRLTIKFTENEQRIKANFGEVYNISDGGYERGYETGFTAGKTEGYNDGYTKGEADGHKSGYEAGHKDGYNTGHADGLASRTYETWTITLADGSIIEKEVALL